MHERPHPRVQEGSSLPQQLIGNTTRLGGSTAIHIQPPHRMSTPYNLKQLGLVTTKAYGLHLRNAARKMGSCPPNPNADNIPVPPGLDPIELVLIDLYDNESVVTFN